MVWVLGLSQWKKRDELWLENRLAFSVLLIDSKHCGSLRYLWSQLYANKDQTYQPHLDPSTSGEGSSRSVFSHCLKLVWMLLHTNPWTSGVACCCCTFRSSFVHTLIPETLIFSAASLLLHHFFLIHLHKNCLKFTGLFLFFVLYFFLNVAVKVLHCFN